MLNAFLQKIEGLFDRRFAQAYWLPVFAAAISALFIWAWGYGLTETWEAWQSLGTAQNPQLGDYARLWLLFAALAAITVLAYLLQALTRPMVQLYEGYWPTWLRRWATRPSAKRWQKLRTRRTQTVDDGNLTQYAALQDRLHHEYPPAESALLPTRLGNVLRAAEAYGGTAYGMDAVFWWPRLWACIPAPVQAEIQASLTPMLALLNLSTLFAVVTVAGGAYMAASQTSWWPCITVVIGGALVVWVSYRGAVAQAREYGQQIRMAVDLYRFDLLKALHQGLPRTPQEERALWERLARWLYNQDRAATKGLVYAQAATEQQEEGQETAGT
jgi:hypothetical protein